MTNPHQCELLAFSSDITASSCVTRPGHDVSMVWWQRALSSWRAVTACPVPAVLVLDGKVVNKLLATYWVRKCELETVTLN